MTMQQHPTPLAEKAQRLLDDGSVRQHAHPAQVFEVDGDHGRYTVLVTAAVQMCSCPARGRCSHMEAAVQWTLAKGAELARLEQARAARADRDRVAADAIFDRLGA